MQGSNGQVNANNAATVLVNAYGNNDFTQVNQHSGIAISLAGTGTTSANVANSANVKVNSYVSASRSSRPFTSS